LWYRNNTTKKTISSQKIVLHGKTIAYTLTAKEGVRYMRITINRDGNLRVTIPYHMPRERADEFLQRKSDWILIKLDHALSVPKISPPTKNDYIIQKEKALIFALEKTKEFNSYYNFTFNTVRIKNQKTLWGSCSRKGNLNFNYKIICIPLRHAEYIIVHELCHLKEFNHSTRFWRLVAQTIPDYKEIRKQLRSNTMKLS